MPIIFANYIDPTWDISGYTLQSSYDLTGIEIRPSGFSWNDDGTKAYVIGIDSDRAHQFSLSTPYDFVTGSVTYDGIGESLDVSGETANPTGGAFSSNGLYYYVSAAAGGRTIFKYELTVPWDISTGVWDNTDFDIDAAMSAAGALGQLIAVSDVTFSQDGDKMFISNGGNGDDGVYQFSCSPNWVINTATYDGVRVLSPVGDITGVKFSTNGKQMFISEDNTNKVFQYNLVTAWRINTAVLQANEFSVTTEGFPYGIASNVDGTAFYICGFLTATIQKYA